MSTEAGAVAGFVAGVALAPATGGASLAWAAGAGGAYAGSKAGKSLEPKMPGVPKAQEPPKTDDPEVQAASAKERKLLRLRRGRASTMLSRPKLQQSGDTLG